MKKNIILSAALMFFGLTAQAQTTITFDSAEPDYKAISVYDSWEESPFRAATPVIDFEAAVVENPDKEIDEVLGAAPNATNKVVKLRRSRYGSNTFGVRIDLKEPIRVTKQLQYIHVMAYLKNKPADSRMMVIGLGKRLEESWNWQTGEDEQFWATTNTAVKPKEGWQDIVVSFKGFSYSKDENANSGIDIHSLVIVPDVRSPHADTEDWYAYIDEIVVDNNPDKRFSTDKYALTYEKDANATRNDRKLNSVGLTSNGVNYSSEVVAGKVYSDNTAKSVFSAKAGTEVQPTFGYTGNWMSGYVYVDWNNDGRFDYGVNDDGTPATGSEIVSYSAAQVNGTWRKSDGTTRNDGNGLSGGMPKFTIPAGTAPGLYRMRYKVDWDNLNPAGASTIISNGGGYIDVMLDVHGDKVSVTASQLNGDIELAAGGTLQNHETNYGESLKVKIKPAPGFVQYGFILKYGYNVTASQQLDDNGNPNWIEVNVPYTAIAGDGTYDIPAEYIRGKQVSIKGDMQQEQLYTVKVVGLEEGQGGVVYANIETAHGGTVYATQFFSAEQATAIPVKGYDGVVTIEDRVVKVTYTVAPEPYREVSSLSDLKNYKLYQIKAKSGEGYLAYNSSITEEYVSLRGVTNHSHNNLPGNEAVAAKYKEAVDPFDETVVWQILSEEGKYYLYHPAKKAYVTRNGRDYKFTETKTALDVIKDNGDGTFGFHAGGGYSEESTNFACICTNENPFPLRNWTWKDHGAVMQIIENPNVYTLEYTIEVIGAGEAGGITMDGKNYAHGEKFTSTQFLTAADVVARDIVLSNAEVELDRENQKITVSYERGDFNPTSCYTLECLATDHTGFISDNGTVIDGRSAEGTLFMFEKAETENGYYIRSKVSNKYINHDGVNISASAERKTAWILDIPTFADGVVTFRVGDNKYLNNNGSDCTDGTCTNLKGNPHDGGPKIGNACSLWKLKEYRVCDVTYSFKYNGVEKYSQTTTINIGSEYPNYNVTLPYGVSASAKPTGTVDADVVYDVTLTIEKEIPFEMVDKIADITTWYYAKLHSNPNESKYIQALENGNIEWTDKEIATEGDNSYLWAFVGDVWNGVKVVNKTGKAIVSTSGDAKLGAAENATVFFISNSAADANGFCLKYPDNANYLNGQGGLVKSWSDNDAGSTFLLEEYVAPETPEEPEEPEDNAIEQVVTEEEAIIYDLSGRRVEKMVEKGIYIRNAKKIVVQ